ncbi:MAG: homoserine dehydrogenase, partial [Armatimonadota bacterium]
MREIGIGILGCGVVGSGTVEILHSNAREIERRVGARLVVRRVAVKDPEKPRPACLDRSLITTDPIAVIADPSVDIVAELVGGVDPAGDWIREGLERGKHIVTANKELMAKAGHPLMDFAAVRNLDFFLEGSVAGGIPILSAMKESLAANRFREVMGIVNGTTNYILTRMTEEGAPFEDVLRDAQRFGY